MSDIDDVILYDHGGSECIRLSPRQQRALHDLIESQIAVDDAGMFPLERGPLERDEDMHGLRHPIQDNNAVVYPIACRRNELARRRDEELGGCRWVKDGEGVSCTTCGKHEGPGMARHETLLPMVEGRYSLRSTTPPIVSIRLARPIVTGE